MRFSSSVWSSFLKKDLFALGLPGFVSGPVSLARVKAVSFGVIDVFITLPGEVLFVFNTVSLWLQQEQLEKTCAWISILVTHVDITRLIRLYTNLVSSVISYEVKPAMPFWWDLRGIVAILGSVFHPPMSTYN